MSNLSLVSAGILQPNPRSIVCCLRSRPIYSRRKHSHSLHEGALKKRLLFICSCVNEEQQESNCERVEIDNVKPVTSECSSSGVLEPYYERRLPDFNDIFIWFCASLVLLIALADGPLQHLVLPPNTALLLLAAVQWGLIVIPTLGHCLRSGYDLKTTFSLKWSSLKFILAAIMGGFSIWVLLTVTIWNRFWTFSASLPAPLPNKGVLVSMFQRYPTTALGWTFLLVWAAISPALVEEILFRGYLLTCLKPHLLRIDAVMLAAALGGMFHLNLPQFFATAALGLVSGVLAVVSGSIFPPILLHSTHNIAALAFGGVTQSGARVDTAAIPTIPFPLWMLLVAMVGMIVFCCIVVSEWVHLEVSSMVDSSNNTPTQS